ncbi:MAG TPA: gamma-glutamylcyclotransferase [Acidobacteriota bacterium]|nr:gamma-glutamylcyclotransferase [Acidobacteriota bacterium]
MSNDQAELMEVFVYGTLMRGESNHHHLAGCEFLGEDILEQAQLWSAGPYPALRQGEGSVIGERFRVTPEVLVQLDWLEDHPRLYLRREVTLKSGATVWVYFGNRIFRHQLVRLPENRWKSPAV